MTTEAKRRANAKYDAKHAKVYTIKLNIKTDADIIAWLEATANRQGYIKRLIRADMRVEKG